MVKAALPAEGAVGRYEILLRAAARAAAKNGVPLMMHTESGKNAVQAVELCIRAGMVPEKIVVCHVDRQAKDFTPHEAVARLGVYLDYDTVGRFKYHSDAEEVTLLQHMMLWSNRILLALDTTAARLDAYDGEIGLTYILNSFPCCVIPVSRKNASTVTFVKNVSSFLPSTQYKKPPIY